MECFLIKSSTLNKLFLFQVENKSLSAYVWVLFPFIYELDLANAKHPIIKYSAITEKSTEKNKVTIDFLYLIESIIAICCKYFANISQNQNFEGQVSDFVVKKKVCEITLQT